MTVLYLVFVVLSLMLFMLARGQHEIISKQREAITKLTEALKQSRDLDVACLNEAAKWRDQFLMKLDAADDDPNLRTVRSLLPDEITEIEEYLAQLTGTHSECAKTSLCLIKTLKEQTNAIGTLQASSLPENVRTSELIGG